MKKMKWLAAMIMAMCMVLALTACGGSGGSAGEDSEGGDLGGTKPAGSSITFETTDLDGEPVISRDLFAENRITMINLWGTYCGPCIREMPDLEEISREYEDRGVEVVGLVVDVPVGNDEMLEDAETILRETGATFRNLRAWDGFSRMLPAPGTPTTYFVDSEGKLVGDPVIGTNVPEYRSRLDQLLSEEQ